MLRLGEGQSACLGDYQSPDNITGSRGEGKSSDTRYTCVVFLHTNVKITDSPELLTLSTLDSHGWSLDQLQSVFELTVDPSRCIEISSPS